MGHIKGAKEFKKLNEGGKLTRKEAMLAYCWDCNGRGLSRADCGVETCPLYQYSPYGSK